MNSLIFPPKFPEKLAAVAFVNGAEAAWQQADSLSAIRWFAENSFAILGYEVWFRQNDRIKTSISTKAGPTIYASAHDRVKGEAWEAYVERSAREATRAIAGFRWPEDASETLRPVYFNLCWADRRTLDASPEK